MSPEVVNKLKIIEDCGQNPQMKLRDLRSLSVLPGNQLERLKGDRKGQYSIRINKQWRACFEWRDGHAYDVEIADYH